VQFQLAEQRCTVTNVNVRAEKHGDDTVIACDVNLRADVAADVLDVFAPGLRAWIYREAKPRDDRQAELIEGGLEQTPIGAELRFEGVLEPLRFKRELASYEVVIAWGETESSLFPRGSVVIELEDAKLHKFMIEPKAGGTCELSLQVQCRQLDDEGRGHLTGLIQKEVKVWAERARTEEERAAEQRKLDAEAAFEGANP
jgi:hypothetical protein